METLRCGSNVGKFFCPSLGVSVRKSCVSQKRSYTSSVRVLEIAFILVVSCVVLLVVWSLKKSVRVCSCVRYYCRSFCLLWFVVFSLSLFCEF